MDCHGMLLVGMLCKGLVPGQWHLRVVPNDAVILLHHLFMPVASLGDAALGDM